MEDDFLKKFLRAAEERQARLEAINVTDEEPSYPHLSPPGRDPELDPEHDHPEHDPELDYSSDLSLQSEVYRAEPIHCDSPPDILPQIDQPIEDKHEQVVQNMEVEINKLNSTIHQLKMALEESKYGSQQHIVAARLLKIDECKHRVFSCHKLMIQKGVRKTSDSLGSLKISEIMFKITDRFKDELAKPGNYHNFFCIASCGADVKSTKLVDTTSVKQQATKDFIEFNKKLLSDDLHFKNLPPDFVVKVELFELIIHPGGRGAIIKDGFDKFSAFATPSKKARTSKEVPRFRSIGNLRLSRKKDDHRIPKLARMTDDENSKYIAKEYQLDMELRPEQLPVKKGKLHMGYLDSNDKRDWTRRWVQVANGQIRLWHSDRDALDGKEPDQTIHLEDLCTKSVQKLTVNHRLYRPNSFALYSKQPFSSGDGDTYFQRVLRGDSNSKIVMLLLATDDREERDSWCHELNRSIYCFSEWHDTVETYTFEQIDEMFS